MERIEAAVVGHIAAGEGPGDPEGVDTAPGSSCPRYC